MAEFTLEAWKDGGWHRFLVTFANARQAIDFINRKSPEDVFVTETADHQIFSADRIGPVSPDEYELLDLLYPQCPHGLAADLCMDWWGENHFGTREQEMAGML